MPRKRQTLSGAPAAPAVTPVDSTYGEGERAIESQRRMPVPQLTGSGGTGSGASQMPSMPASPGGMSSVPNDPKARLEMAMQALQRMAPPQGLSAPSQRPYEPFTAGMPMGAGPGPEVLRPGDRVAQTLRTIADLTDNARIRELADLANMRGGM